MASIRTTSSPTSTTSSSTGSTPTSAWSRRLPRLPGRKFVFTNGDAPYARRVLDRIGVAEHFDDLHDIHASELSAQARPARLCSCCANGSASIPQRALFADDMVRNLAPAKALGMTTVWVDNGSERGDHGYRRRRRRRSHRRRRATGSKAILGDER